MNLAGPAIAEENIGKTITCPMSKRSPMEKTKNKFIDDLTLAVSINLKDKLVLDENQVRPVPQRSRTYHRLPRAHNRMQDDLNNLVKYTEDHQMKINSDKTKAILFNSRRSIDFTPELDLGDSQVEIVEEVKLLGVSITSDLRWTSNTEYLCTKGYKRLWLLRRLKTLGAEKEELVDIYRQQVLSILEFAAPVWSGSLSVADSLKIERVQKAALHIILGEDYSSYDDAIKELKVESLSKRRVSICTKFAIKAFRSTKYNTWFCRSETSKYNTRAQKQIFKEATCRTNRYSKSPIPYLTKLLNEHNWTEKELMFM